MNIHIISTEQEKRAWIDPLGPTYDPASDAEFAAFERKYLAAYDVIMDAILKVASLQEDGEPAKADLSTSRWMEPQRLFGVVVLNKAALQPARCSRLFTPRCRSSLARRRASSRSRWMLGRPKCSSCLGRTC